MGANHSQLDVNDLQDYKELTYLTEKEIVNVFNRFKKMAPRELDQNKWARIPSSTVMQIPELKNNPFADRLCKVFSSENDDALSFEDFLDMVDVLGENTPAIKKASYAFMVYDFDEDGYLSREDIEELVRRLTASEDHTIVPKQLDFLVDKVFLETDLDKNNKISKEEFQHVVGKSYDFIRSFHFRL